MNEFNKLDVAKNNAENKQRIQDIERISSLWANLTGQAFDEDMNISKLRTLVLPRTYEFIARDAHKCKKYSELVQMIEAQTPDPITGTMKGEKTPNLSNVNQNSEQ